MLVEKSEFTTTGLTDGEVKAPEAAMFRKMMTGEYPGQKRIAVKLIEEPVRDTNSKWSEVLKRKIKSLLNKLRKRRGPYSAST